MRARGSLMSGCRCWSIAVQAARALQPSSAPTSSARVAWTCKMQSLWSDAAGLLRSRTPASWNNSMLGVASSVKLRAMSTPSHHRIARPCWVLCRTEHVTGARSKRTSSRHLTIARGPAELISSRLLRSFQESMAGCSTSKWITWVSVIILPLPAALP